MKNANNKTAGELQITNGAYSFPFIAGQSNKSNQTSGELNGNRSLTTEFREEGILTPGVVFQMATGQIPDLWDVCMAMAGTFNEAHKVNSAMQFIPVMQNLQAPEQEQVKRFLKNPETRQVLISNDHLEVVLIHWKPGKVSEIHGHPRGGCLFKLLQGKLEEIRYTPEKSPKLLATTSYRSGSMAYIDDRIAYHQVGNPYGSPAISLHVYLK
jgi:predicted metal-dependent enzyme (double-stranded beta helix superfamily)